MVGVLLVGALTASTLSAALAQSDSALFVGRVVAKQEGPKILNLSVQAVRRPGLATLAISEGTVVGAHYVEGFTKVRKFGQTGKTFADIAAGDYFAQAETQYDSQTGNVVLVSIQIVSAGPAPIGTVKLAATVDGKEWSGALSYTYCVSAYGCVNTPYAETLPATYLQQPAANTDYTFVFASGGPEGKKFVGVTPANKQQLATDGTITFTFNFVDATSYNQAACVSVEAPDSVAPGQRFSATVRVGNTGANTWNGTDSTPHRLGAQKPQDGTAWGTARVALSEPVAPGQEAAFVFTATAPRSAGTYPFSWQMVEEKIEWFGPVCSKQIIVGASDSQFKTFKGEVLAVAPEVQTLQVSQGNVGSVTVAVDAATIITKEGKPAALSDIVAGATVVAQGIMVEPGKVQASAVNITATPRPESVSVSFGGTVLAADLSAKALHADVNIVYQQETAIVFPGIAVAMTVTDQTVITKAEAPASLADLEAGDTFNAQGLYSVADGVLTANKITVVNRVPVLISVTPQTVSAATRTDLSFAGWHFQEGAVIENPELGVLGTQFISSSELRVVGLWFALPGSYHLRVRNPDGVLSNQVTLTVQ